MDLLSRGIFGRTKKCRVEFFFFFFSLAIHSAVPFFWFSGRMTRGCCRSHAGHDLGPTQE